jgi:uncharacterized RDD family membrane protein YckC
LPGSPEVGPPESPAATPTAPTSAATDDALAALLSQITDEDSSTPTVGAELTKPTDVERPERARVARVESEGGIAFDPALASYGARFVGLVVDDLVTAVCMSPGIVLVVVGSPPLIILGIVLILAGFAGATVAYARSVSSTGQWIGNRVTGTRVVDVRNGKTVAVAEAGLRFVIRFWVSSILLIGFLVALGNSQRRTFHDNIAGTVVTRPPRASWSIDDEASAG